MIKQYHRRTGGKDMALTRKFLKAMGIEDEKIDQIIDAHTETVDGLKEKLRAAEDDSKTLKEVQK